MRLHRLFLLATVSGSLVLFAIGVVSAEFVLALVVSSVEAYLAHRAPIAPIRQLAEPEPKAEDRDAA